MVTGLQALIFRHSQTEIADILRLVFEKLPFLEDWRKIGIDLHCVAGEAVQTTQHGSFESPAPPTNMGQGIVGRDDIGGLGRLRSRVRQNPMPMYTYG